MKVLIKNNKVHSTYSNGMSDEDIFDGRKDKSLKIYKVSNSLNVLGSGPSIELSIAEMETHQEKTTITSQFNTSKIADMSIEDVKKAAIEYARQ